jgi:FAD/FMN-containing dehydrogenase
MAIEPTFGVSSAVSAYNLAGFAAGFAGTVITPRDEGYDAARRVCNGRILRRPAAIARCVDADDVTAAIRFARGHGLPIAVRGRGHDITATAVCDGGIVVDLSPIRAVHLDPSRATVHAEAGAAWRDIDELTQLHGLATPGGVVSTSGVAGHALNGGLSHQRRLHGMTIDNLVSAEVVTVDGRQIHASADEHPDLHWALRGGGGNFGVVTSFELVLHDIGRDVYALDVAYPIRDARRVLRRWRDAAAAGPDALTSDAVLWSPPVAPEVPRPVRGLECVTVTGMYVGDPADGERLTRVLRSLSTPMLDASGPRAYLDLQSSNDALFPAGRRCDWQALYLDDLADASIDEIVDRHARRPSAQSHTVIHHLGGAIARVAPADTAFAHRAAEFMLSINATWRSPRNDARNSRWVHDFHAAQRRYCWGPADLDLSGPNAAERAAVEQSYGPNYHRLARIKAVYDRENVLRLNQNILPRLSCADSPIA